MTVSSALDRKTFTGDDLTVAFATTPVVFFDETDLKVYVITIATGVAVLQSLTTDYTVTGGAGSTGTVTMLTAPASTEQLLIKRVVPITQAVDLVNNDASDAETMEDSLDKLTMIAQQLSAGSVSGGYPLRISDAETPTDALTVLPFDRADMILGFNSAKELTAYEPANGANDSSSVTFVQSGTGATPETVQDVLRAFAKFPEQYGAVGDGVTDDTTAVNACITAAGAGGYVYLPSLYKMTAQAVPLTNQTWFGRGWSTGLDVTASGFAAKFAVQGASFENFKVVASDEGVDFNTAGNTNATYNYCRRINVEGPGRGAARATNSKSAFRFQRMTGAFAAFHNHLIDCKATGFNTLVNFDAANGQSATGGNANTVSNLEGSSYWNKYKIQSYGNTITGGFSTGSAGIDATDYVVAYWITNSATYNTIIPEIGEPGTNAYAYIFDAGTENNTFYKPANLNFDLGFTDAGLNKIVDNFGQSQSYTGLTENNYYTIPLYLAWTANYSSGRCKVLWASTAPTLTATGAGEVDITFKRAASTVAVVVDGNKFTTNGAAPVVFQGIYVASDVPHLVFFARNNGSATSNGRVSVKVLEQGSSGAPLLQLGTTATSQGTSDPSTTLPSTGVSTVTDAAYTVAETDFNVICNRAGTVTLTLPSAVIFRGRELTVRTIQAQQVDSASSNVVPRIGGAAGTAIVGASDGAWATLVSDGTDWQIMAGS